MARQRYVNTKFWSDTFITSLKPLNRYLFLYLLTNEHTNIAGIYELPLIRIIQESGISKESIQKVLKSLDSRVCYADGWVVFRNFQRHQSKGQKIRVGIESIMAELPNKIKDFYLNWTKNSDTPLIGYRYPSNYININNNINNNINENSKECASLFSAYKEKIRKNAQLTDESKRKIQLRLKSYKLDQLLEAISRFSSNSWWMENNSGRGIAWFFHSDDRIEQFLAIEPQKKVPHHIEL
mgnify:CR=1 FL=1